MQKANVLIYEDTNEFRKEIRQTIESNFPEFEVKGDFPDCSKVEEEVRQFKPKIVVMDIRMPNVNGLAGLNIIKQKFNNIKVLMLTDFNDDANILKAIRLGCDGYMLKEDFPNGLESAMKNVLTGETAYLTPTVAKRVMTFVAKPKLFFRSNKYKLTKMQTEVLKLLAKGYTYKEIAAELFITANTVGSHVKDIYDKLNVNNRTKAAQKAINEGLIDLD